MVGARGRRHVRERAHRGRAAPPRCDSLIPEPPMIRLFALGLLSVALSAVAQAQPRTYDLVIANGRAVDPETGLDAVRWIGIRDGRIAAVSALPLRGTQVLDAKGHVVAPGFIDLHAHGQQIAAARMQAFDGVTTALELEAGTLPVGKAYDDAARLGRPINYGFSAAWVFGRIAEKEHMEPDGAISYFQEAQKRTGWQFSVADSAEITRIMARVEQGLKEGALGIGVLAGYAPGHGRKEYFALGRLAKAYNVPTFTHVRY
ncbi:MAG: amidohydrolase family protein, partial [Gemmatimonadetes bacterium]|nr:amidohydrolase family protein [Gemmatimonadota bacterium]